MDDRQSGGSDTLRREIAVAAARLIADAGLDYGSAKRKAARQVLGGDSVPKGALPDGDEIDEALREHLDLFDEDHAQRVQRMRQVALRLMQRLSEFQPYLTGAVWKGIVTEHAPIHLQLFYDDVKDVEMFLLNDGIAFEVTEIPHFRSDRQVEALTFEWQSEPVMVSLYRHDDLRGALRPQRSPDGGEARSSRGSCEQVAALLAP
ncbi:MAG TPA: hypothetical protein VM491_03925 [Burkholderiaceae bacterium]|nr:hypothetical protein [Burkholderiaceae bacterium]